MKPEYIVCHVCKHEIKINYDVKRKNDCPKVEEVISLCLDMKSTAGSSEKKEYRRMVSIAYICTHCKGIIGFGR